MIAHDVIPISNNRRIYDHLKKLPWSLAVSQNNDWYECSGMSDKRQQATYAICDPEPIG